MDSRSGINTALKSQKSALLGSRSHQQAHDALRARAEEFNAFLAR
jgi:hypothetical protein